MQESEIAELEEVINGLKGHQGDLEAELAKLKKKKLECFKESDNCEKGVDQVSAKMEALQVHIAYIYTYLAE